ncbi:pyridoxal-phosphate dependent enzyme [Pseudomonas sp. GOM7]|uniref:1-aminocyclopropane-1-carboxylate deaminase/D-cysteine desulfhydrase n=1 Tax=unclassified Pseudomonas TaxID=196821 RepID=UPI00227AF571|nr:MULTISPECIES: pyridoxal-phosphate dependent enzyme [unclassified Pseudomonas]WAJ39110.1 pyridoxal-phosphate dependent enzyme [Pseudomonas sp. GOM7]
MLLPRIDWQPQAPLQPLRLDWLQAAGVEVACLRLDLIDALISGNKWFKLAPHLREAHLAGAHGVISLGGAHSNHLHALAAAGRRFGFATVGLLRGEPQLTPTVRDLQVLGMQLHWLSHGAYRKRHEPGFWAPWLARHPHCYPINEGGRALLGAQGCAVLVGLVERQMAALGWADFHGWWLAAGTGTTLAGLVLAEQGERPVHGALAVPAGYGVPEQVSELLREAGCDDQGYRLIEAARRGFARSDDELLAFMAAVERDAGLLLEPVYTGKALLALRQQVSDGYFRRGSRLVFVHTGGLQGRRATLGSHHDYTVLQSLDAF